MQEPGDPSGKRRGPNAAGAAPKARRSPATPRMPPRHRMCATARTPATRPFAACPACNPCRAPCKAPGRGARASCAHRAAGQPRSPAAVRRSHATWRPQRGGGQAPGPPGGGAGAAAGRHGSREQVRARLCTRAASHSFNAVTVPANPLSCIHAQVAFTSQRCPARPMPCSQDVRRASPRDGGGACHDAGRGRQAAAPAAGPAGEAPKRHVFAKRLARARVGLRAFQELVCEAVLLVARRLSAAPPRRWSLRAALRPSLPPPRAPSRGALRRQGHVWPRLCRTAAAVRRRRCP
jgi:hypothetical protein